MATALLTQTTLLAVIIISCCDVIMCQNDAHCNDAGQPVKCYFSECIHGICVNVTYEFGGRTLSLEECKCDTGWTGFYCDTCCKCDPDEICVFQNFPFPPKCIRNDTSNETTTTLTYTDEVRDQSPVETTTSQTTTTLPYTDEIRNQSTIETTTSQTTTTLPYTDEIRDQSAIETTTSQTTTTLPYTDEIRDQSAIETTTSQTTTTLTYTDEIRDQSTIETTTSQGRYPARNSTTLTYTDEVRDQSPIETTTSQCRYPARNSTPCYIKHADSRCVNGICEETYCNCDQGWGGFECEVCCDLPCVHGLCDATIVGDPKCACETAYQGDLCDEIKPKEVVPIGIWVWCLVGVACAALLASVIVIAVLWKQRNIIILKIVCKIQMMKYDRNFEKDKKYDVCISCAGSDERFVETWILPHLERELGYKVWMKARDAMPGDVNSKPVEQSTTVHGTAPPN